MKKTSIFYALCLLFLFSCTSKENNEQADFVYTNGKVYTMNDSLPWAEAVAVKGKEIIFVGSSKDAKSYIGKNTEVTDLDGKMMMPGFVESHLHPTLSWLTVGADLQTDDVNEILERLKKWSAENPDSKVIRGFGWRYGLFPPEGPDKKVLDSLFPNKPVFLFAIDAHGGWVNSKALEMVGVNSTTPDPQPPFSSYQRYKGSKEPSGFLIEGPAVLSVLNKLVTLDSASAKMAMSEFLPKFSAAGITTALDAGIQGIPQEDGYKLYVDFEKNNLLPIRIFGSYYHNNPDIDPFPPFEHLHKTYQTELVKANLLKLNIDGGEAQFTAAMLHPYVNKNGFKGNLLLPTKVLNKIIIEAREKGISTIAHIIGDNATHEYLNAIENGESKVPNSQSRHIATHIVYIDSADIPRFKQLGVIAQFSAQWATPDPSIFGMIKSRVGEYYVNNKYIQIGSMLKSGAVVALGTDWPAAGYFSSYKPLDAIQVAITREMITGNGVIKQLPPASEVITLKEALYANTMGSAYTIKMEKQIGSIEKGKLADLIILEKNLFEIDPHEIHKTKVLMTMMNGKIRQQQ